MAMVIDVGLRGLTTKGGIGNYRVLAAVLFVAMLLLYWTFA